LVCNIGSRFKVDTGAFGFTGCKSITVNYPLPDSVENWSFQAPDTNITFTVVISSPTTVYGNTLPLSNYGVKNYGAYTYKFQVINVEYKLYCETIDIFVYETSNTGVCIVYYKDDLLIWNNIYDTLSLPTNYTWNLNNDGDPTHAIVKNGSTVTYEYPHPIFIQGPTIVNPSKSYNVYVKSNDIYEDFTPKYLEKSTNNCVNIIASYTTMPWYSNASPGLYTNGYGYFGLSLVNGYIGLFSLDVSQIENLNSCKILALTNKEYYIKFGWLNVTASGTALNASLMAMKYVGNILYFWYVWETTYSRLVKINLPNSISTSIDMGNGTGSSAYGIIFQEYLISKLGFTTPGGVFIQGNIRKLNSPTVLDSTSYISYPNWVYYNVTDSVNINDDYILCFNSYHHYQIIEDLNGSIETSMLSISYPANMGGIYGRSCCVHKGVIYLSGLCDGQHSLFSFDPALGILSLVSHKISYSAVNLVSYGDYLVGISNSGDYQYAPSIDIFNDNDLGI
jgi:hypothetical protein